MRNTEQKQKSTLEKEKKDQDKLLVKLTDREKKLKKDLAEKQAAKKKLDRAIENVIKKEIRQARKKKAAAITLKMNSLSDEEMIQKLYDAAKAGVQIKLIIRGVFCMFSENKKYEKPVRAISIVDEYLEHARVWVFHNRGKEKVYISSADWMVRNLEHRVEATCPIWNQQLKQELKDILDIQLQDNVKARWLDNELSNEYVRTTKKKIRSQVETYNYLFNKTNIHRETGSN